MKQKLLLLILLSSLNVLIIPQYTFAHCDGIDGPVVTAAKNALETGNVNLVLIWVQENDTEYIKNVFNHTLKVRKLGEDAQKLADRFFFETIVRVHREGEGAPFTGLKPAGRDLGPAIPAADLSIETGSASELVKLLNDAVTTGVHTRFEKVAQLKNYGPDDVAAGQKYVKAYVDYLHFAEGIYDATLKTEHGHGEIERVNTDNHENH